MLRRGCECRRHGLCLSVLTEVRQPTNAFIWHVGKLSLETGDDLPASRRPNGLHLHYGLFGELIPRISRGWLLTSAGSICPALHLQGHTRKHASCVGPAEHRVLMVYFGAESPPVHRALSFPHLLSHSSEPSAGRAASISTIPISRKGNGGSEDEASSASSHSSRDYNSHRCKYIQRAVIQLTTLASPGHPASGPLCRCWYVSFRV